MPNLHSEVATELLNAVAQVIRELRAKNRISQREMAISTQLNRSYLSDLETGKVNPSLANLARIAHALGVKTSDLFVLAEQKVAVKENNADAESSGDDATTVTVEKSGETLLARSAGAHNQVD